MRPLRLCLEDYMGHHSTDIDCTQFKTALIIGRNKNDPRKSMGVGKTTIFKAIEYVFFGKTPTQLDRIVRNGCDKCKVIFEFEIENIQYKIIRSRNKKSNRSDLRMYQKSGNDWHDITQKTSSETEFELAKLLKISHVAFRTSILFAQGDLYGIASATPANRRKMLKEPLQISIYNKYEKISADKTSLALKEVDKIKTIISSLGNPCLDIISLSEEITKINLELDELTKTSFSYQEKLDRQRVALADLQKSITADPDKIQRGLVNVQQSVRQLQDKIKSVNSNILNNKNKIETSLQEILSLRESLWKWNATRTELINNSLRSKEDIKADVVKMTNKEIDGKAYIAKLKMDYSALEHSIPNGDMCSRCQQAVSEQHRENCEIKRLKEFEIVKDDIIKYKNLLDIVKSKKIVFENELSDVEKKENLLINLDNRIANNKNETLQSEKLLKQLNEMFDSKNIELKELIQNESSLIIKENELKNELNLINKNSVKEDINNLIKEINNIEILLKEVSKKISSYNITLGMLQEKIKIRQTDKESLNYKSIELINAEHQYSMRLKVRQAFSSAGIPTMIINTILDDLQITTNDLLAKIRPELEMAFVVAKTNGDGQEEDTLDVVYRINGIEHDYEQLSGGQKVLISLCLKLSLSLIIQRRIGVDIKFLMLDEVDASFDDSGLESYVEIIKKWQDKFTIFVITHNKDLKEKFSHAILVEGDDVAGATGKLVNSW